MQIPVVLKSFINLKTVHSLKCIIKTFLIEILLCYETGNSFELSNIFIQGIESKYTILSHNDILIT